MDKSDDWMKKIRNGDAGIMLDDIPALLAVLGLKLVDVNKVCVDREVAKAYETIARQAILRTDLIWDDPE